VVGADDPPHLAHEAADLVEHPLALDRVGAHDLPLRGVELARLVDDVLRDGHLAHVVQERGELEVPPPRGVQAEAVAHLEGEGDDAARVLAGVGVVGLHDVPEHEGGPAVGRVELDQAVDPGPPLAGEDGEHAEQRQQPEHADGRLLGAPGRHQADRGQRDVDGVHPGLLDLLAERRAVDERLAQGGGAEVERELRGERRQQQRRGRVLRRLGRGDGEDERGADGEPGVREDRQQPDRAQPPAQDLGELGRRPGDDDGQGDERGGDGEEQRDEGELARHGDAVPDVELDPQRHRERDHARARQERVPLSGGRGEPGEEGQHREDEGAAHGDLGLALLRAQALAPPVPRVGHELLLADVGIQVHERRSVQRTASWDGGGPDELEALRGSMKTSSTRASAPAATRAPSAFTAVKRRATSRAPQSAPPSSGRSATSGDTRQPAPTGVLANGSTWPVRTQPASSACG
jgi:hypothetical protein